MAAKRPDAINTPPFETEELRKQLAAFLDAPFTTEGGEICKVGDFKWGVYAFFDYDLEPIYVGQTNEKLRTRIRRHLTNQRTDAVAMSVLDPFEVFEIEVWPLPDLQNVDGKNAEARLQLNALERVITAKAVVESKFQAILNEKDPPPGTLAIIPPPSKRGRVVSDAVHGLRSHPDFRIARRSLIISRLAQVISERKVQGGLRRVLLTQAKRLQWLADRRFEALGGERTVETENETEGPDEDN
jgi:hypothetical protein